MTVENFSFAGEEELMSVEQTVESLKYNVVISAYYAPVLQELQKDLPLIEEIKDPDTGQRWESDNTSYVVTNNETIEEVCIKGKERKLCGNKDDEPVLIENLSPEDVVSY